MFPPATSGSTLNEHPDVGIAYIRVSSYLYKQFIHLFPYLPEVSPRYYAHSTERILSLAICAIHPLKGSALGEGTDRKKSVIESDTPVIDEKDIYHTQDMLIYEGYKEKSDRVTDKPRETENLFTALYDVIGK